MTSTIFGVLSVETHRKTKANAVVMSIAKRMTISICATTVVYPHRSIIS
jgi:hypothetical protein